MATPARNYDHLFKFVVIGDTSVGKTSLITQFVPGAYSSPTFASIAVDFLCRLVDLDGTKVKVQIWDALLYGERFPNLYRGYFRSVHCVFLVFDVTHRDSFRHVTKWLHQTHEYCNTPATVLLIGNKCDLADQREVSTEEAKEYASERGLAYVETSAKTGENVEGAFLDATRCVLDRVLASEFRSTVSASRTALVVQPQKESGMARIWLVGGAALATSAALAAWQLIPNLLAR
jgi:small GTP-binding protein